MDEIAAISLKPTQLKHTEGIVIHTDRPGDFYISLLGLKKEKLIGKKLLNIGAGGSDLQADLKTKGLEVFNVDLRYKGGNRRGVKNSTPIAGSMLVLPIADNSVNISTSLYGKGYIPKRYSQLALTEMIRVTADQATIYPCGARKQVREFLKQNNLESVFKVESSPFDLKLLLANVTTSQGFFGNLARIVKNLYYVEVETLGKLDNSKRITINTHEFKKNPNWQEITKKLIKLGLTLDA